MFKQNRLTVLSIAVLLALLVAAVLPFAAFAQDGGEQPPAGEAVPPVEEAVPPVDEAVPPVEDEVVPPVEDLTVPEIMDQLPPETDLVVLDQAGEALPLASVEAAEVLASADPWYMEGANKIGWTTLTGTCVSGVSVCNHSATPIQAAVNAFGASTTATGAIYVEAGVYTEDVEIPGYNTAEYPNILNLTGLIGAGGLNSATTLDGWIGIYEMTNDFTLSGFDIWNYDDSGGVDGDYTGVMAGGNTGTLTLEDLWVENDAGEGVLVLEHTGDVFVNNVDSSYNGGPGAVIFATGDVDVQNSAFDHNDSFGLHVVSKEGAVTITNSEFNDNEREGLRVDTVEGDITLENVTANGNGFGYKDVPPGPGSGPAGLVPLADFGPFEGFEGSGIILQTGMLFDTGVSSANVVPGGKITLNNVITSGNWGNGVSILSVGDVSVKCGTFENNGKYGGVVRLSGGTLTDDSNTFNGNASGEGLVIGGTVVNKSSGCGGGENAKKPVIGTYLPQVIAVPTLLTDAGLPGALPDGKTFVAGASVKLMLAGEEIEEWPAGVQVSFDIPAGMMPPFTVLSWNGTAWVEIPSTVVDGKVVFTVTGPGTFVLVSP